MTTPNQPRDITTAAVAEEPKGPTTIVDPPKGGDAPPSIEHHKKSHDMPPDYSKLADPTAPRVPSYAQATHQNPRTSTIEQLLPSEEERLASLRAFVEEKKYAPDYFGGHKGSAQGQPNDPFKPFRWAKRKIEGEKGHVWHKLTEEQRREWEASGGVVDEDHGEVSKGDVDSSTVA
jgi:hypothetical protein